MSPSANGVVRALLDEPNLKVSVVVLDEVARDARRRHGLAPASASLFAQGLVGGALMASLGKGATRVNLQLECDGPLRGFFVDAATDGDIRGFVKNPSLEVELSSGVFQWRAALGNSGFISVLRDVGGEFYRSSVELITMRFSDDLNHYFATSDQVPTRVAITVQRRGDEPLGRVAGVLLQLLPSGDEAALKKLGSDLESRLHDACEKLSSLTPAALCTELFPQARQLLDTPVQFACTCSREKALATLRALGPDEVQDIVDTLGSTAVTCQFCGTKHEVSLPDLWEILAALGRPVRPN